MHSNPRGVLGRGRSVVSTFEDRPVYDSASRRPPIIAELKELIRYRDLVLQLIARNIKTRYKRSALGVLWTLLSPLMMMAVLTLVFKNVFRFSAQNYPVYVLTGLALWNFFAQTTTGAMSELIWGGGLMNRIYMPRAIFAVAALGTAFVNLLFSLAPLLVLMLALRSPIKPALLFLPVPIVLAAMFALGVALALSTFAVYFSDVLEMYQILLTAWMYLTPIIYPKEIVPESLRIVLDFNPMVHVLETFRAPIYSGALPSPKTLAIASGTALVTLLLGWWIFSRKADELAYRV
jgi:ABC-type polysaccharide/polyol phosphate export permease